MSWADLDIQTWCAGSSACAYPTDKVCDVHQLAAEVIRLRKWDAQLRQWLIDREVEVGSIDLSGPPPAEEAMTLDEIRERLRLEEA